jgi:hypothetical protein
MRPKGQKAPSVVNGTELSRLSASVYGPALLAVGATVTPRLSRRRGLRYRYRLVAAMLLVSLPLMVVLAVLLTTAASTSLTLSAQSQGESVARAVTLRLEDWLSERQQGLRLLAATASGHLAAKETQAELGKIDSTYNDFSLIELTDRQGARLEPQRWQHRGRRTGLVPHRRGWRVGSDIAAPPGRPNPLDHCPARAGQQRPR